MFRFFIYIIMAIAFSANAVTLHLAGDSTVATYSKHMAPMNGWGQQLQTFAKNGVHIRNCAVPGDSAKYFLEQGRWGKLMARVKPGDYVLIQFGHNDQKKDLKTHYAAADDGYTKILQSFIDSVISAKATPILVTSVCRRYFRKNGTIWNSLAGYPNAMRKLAVKNKIGLIDLNAISEFKFSELGDAATIPLFVFVEPGKYKAFPNGSKDNTHLSEMGAKTISEWIVADMHRQKLPIASYFNSTDANIEPPVAGKIKIDIDGTAEGVPFDNSSNNLTLNFMRAQWLPQAKREQYGIFSSKSILGKSWKLYTFSFMPKNTGMITLKIRGGYSKGNMEWIAYDDFRISGAEMFNPNFEVLNKGLFAGYLLSLDNVISDATRAGSGKYYAIAAHDNFLEQPLEVTKGEKVTISFLARFEKITPITVPKARVNLISSKPLSYYRFHNSIVKYLPLADKGIPGSRIGKRKPNATRPILPLLPATVGTDKSNNVSIPFSLLEEDGYAGVRNISFGLPLSRGIFFDCKSLILTDSTGKEIKVGIRPIGLWPDKSVKFAQISFSDHFNAGENKSYFINSGELRKDDMGISCKETNNYILIDTGSLQTKIGKKTFRLLEDIKINRKIINAFDPRGAILTSESGKLLGMSDQAAESVKVEFNDGEQLVVVAKGRYIGIDAGYEARLFFFRNSAEVRLELSLCNRNLKNEFTDYTSWSLPISGQWTNLKIDNVPVKHSIRQWSERDGERDGRKLALKSTGLIKADGVNPIQMRMLNMAERWPKGVDFSENKLTLQLLPPQPNKNFGTNLPYYLMFPFCEGKYRLKWGMRFTETLTINFSGEAMPGTRPIAVIDRNYLNSCGMFPGVPATDNHQFDAMDARIKEALQAHLALKKYRREYGFLNYGDWFGERGKNWGNNEYDLAHGLFQYFLRSGNRDAWHLAMVSAQHQADVDIIHDYPDPYYIGANAQHSIGHTGVSYQPINPATWSYRFDYSISGENGHTWCDGMLEAAMLGADRRVMESALLLGEHLSKHTSNDLKHLGSHERSVGWSLRALIALYRTTGSVEYLNACKRLVNVALKDYKGKEGAWSHLLPPDHANNITNAYGNACFLIAILCDSLVQYEIETGDIAVRQAVNNSAAWFIKTWDNKALGWPYTADAKGKAYWPAFSTLNFLIAPVLLESVDTKNQDQANQIATKVLDLGTFSGVSRIGKEFGYTLFYLPELYGKLMQMPEEKSYRYDPVISPQRITKEFVEKNAFPNGIPKMLDSKVFIVNTRGRFYLKPNGKDSITLRVRGISGGRYSVVVLDHRGRIVGSCEGLHGAGIQGSGLNGQTGQIKLPVNSLNVQYGFEVIFSGSGQIGFAVDGTPCSISTENL